MKKRMILVYSTILLVAIGITACTKNQSSVKQDLPPFGSEVDVSYSQSLWKALV